MVYQQKPWLKLYHPSVGENVSVEYDSLYSMLRQAVREHSEKTALTFFGRSWNYKETKTFVKMFAGALHHSGFSKGDRLSIMLPNCPQYIFSLFANFRLGGIAVQVNPMYVEREIEYILNDSDSEYIVVLDALYDKVKKVQPNTSLKMIIAVNLGGNKIQLEAGDRYFDEFLNPTVQVPEAMINPDEDVAMLQYTGGTTGLSKGVMLTHKNLLANITQVCDFSFKPCEHKPDNPKIMGVLPMFHVFGLSCNALSGIREGCNQLIMPRFNPKEVMELIKKEKPFQMSAVPTMYTALLSQPGVEECGFNDIYYISSGGSSLAVEQVKSFEKKTGGTLMDGYGLSEAAPSAIFNPPFLPRRLGSVGIPLPGTEARIVQGTEENFVDVPAGEPGELIIRGPQVMKGYWKRPDETNMVLKNGWLFTGDIAKMDEDGYFYILDRKKDMIIASGYNIYPREIEEVLYQHGAIEEAIVVGVPDDYRGETVKAYVKLSTNAKVTSQGILEFAKANLAPYKVPKEIEILDDLPKSSVGKLLKRELRKEIMSVKVKA